MTELIAARSPQFKARAAGFCWSMSVVTGALALRFGVAPTLASTVFYVGATLFVYELLKPVNRRVSLLAAISSLLGCVVGTLSLFDLISATNVQFLFFGLHCLSVGYLILGSTFLPRTVGALMAFGGLGWFTLGLLSLLSPALGRSLFPYLMLPGVVAETALSLWLLAMGVDAERWKARASVAGARR
jgi:hypothetical protein